MIIKELSLRGKDFYSVHLEIINPLLPVKLTVKEIDVLSVLLHFSNTQALQEAFKNNFRKYLRDILFMSSASLYNYMQSLQKKGALLDNKGTVNDLLIPSNTQEYRFRIKREF